MQDGLKFTMFTEIKTILGLLAGFITLAAFFPYIFSTIKGKTKPERATWWIWALNSVLLLTSYRAEGAQETIWLAVAYTFGCVTVGLFTIKYGIGGWTKLDRFSLVGSIIAVISWIIIGPLATFIASLLIDLFGVTPTIYRSFYHPEEEDKLSWIMWFIGAFLSLLLVDNIYVWQEWSLETLIIAAYPAQITITTAIIVWFLSREKLKHSPRKID